MTATELAPVNTPGLPPEADAISDAPDPKRRLKLGAWLAIGWLVIIVGAAALADVLPFHDPAAAVASAPRLAPGEEGLWLGSDGNSRDMLSRTVYGARTSLTIGFGSVAIGLVVGGLLGLVGGYYRNWAGTVLTSLFDILLAVPPLVLAMSLVSVLKGNPAVNEGARLPTLWILVLALGLVSIPLLARITRGSTMAWSQREFVTAARAQGATDRRILFREILPNVLPAMVYIALLGVAIAIVAEGGLAVLGASVEPPTTSWGRMIKDGQSDQEEAPFIMFVPIVATFFTVMSLNYLGDMIRDRFDVRESAL